MKLKEILISFLLLYCLAKGQKVNENCGQKSNSVRGSIIGGRPTKPNEWPWLAAFFNTFENDFFCAGSLVTSKHIVSASHCFKDKHQIETTPAEHVLALLGKHNLSILQEPGSVDSSVLEIILHPDWNSTNDFFDADLSLIVLENSVEFSAKIKPVCLPLQRNLEFIGKGTVSGWGLTANSTDYQETPNQLELRTVSQSKCFEEVPDLQFAASNRTFCGGFINQAKSTCTGDSGGGLYTRNFSQRKFELRGVVSASLMDGFGQCNENVYSIFTNVARFSQWIKSKVEENPEKRWTKAELDCRILPNPRTREKKAANNRFPWIVLFKDLPKNVFFCAGNLVTSKHVVTMAHCFKGKYGENRPREEVLAVLGKQNSNITQDPGSVERSIQEIILHPDWSTLTDNFDADISVVVLSEAVEFTNKIRPICLPAQISIEVTGEGIIAGFVVDWVSIDLKPKQSQLKLPAVTQSQCFLSHPGFARISSERTFCAGFLNKAKSACTFLHGQGFYFRNPSARSFELRGLVSATLFDRFGGCDMNVYTLFTDVTKFADWVRSKVK